MNYSLYLFDEHPTHPQEIAFMFTQILGIHKIDAVHQVRRAHGCLIPLISYEKAEEFQKHLKILGISTFIVPNPNQFHLLRPRRLKRLEITSAGLNVHQEFYPWNQLGILSFGFLGQSLAAEEIVELPAFQNMVTFTDPLARKALKEKVVQDIFQGQSQRNQEVSNQTCFLDLLFHGSSPQFFRLRREEVQFFGLSETHQSSLLNFKLYVEKILEFSRCPNITPPTQDFLEDPYQPKYFFDSEDHLNRYTRWYFQKFIYLAKNASEPRQTTEISDLDPEELASDSEPEKLVSKTEEMSFPTFLPYRPRELSTPLSSLDSFLPSPDLELKLQAVAEEEAELPSFPWIYFVLAFFGHAICVFLLASLMLVSEMFLAQMGKPFPKGLPFILRESIGIYSHYFFTPMLFYVFSEIAFVLNLLPKTFRKKYYVFFIIVQGLITLIVGTFALVLMFR